MIAFFKDDVLDNTKVHFPHQCTHFSHELVTDGFIGQDIKRTNGFADVTLVHNCHVVTKKLELKFLKSRCKFPTVVVFLKDTEGEHETRKVRVGIGRSMTDDRSPDHNASSYPLPDVGVCRGVLFRPLTLSRLLKGRKRERKGASVDTTDATR